jgi:hypothetical protein
MRLRPSEKGVKGATPPHHLLLKLQIYMDISRLPATTTEFRKFLGMNEWLELGFDCVQAIQFEG